MCKLPDFNGTALHSTRQLETRPTLNRQPPDASEQALLNQSWLRREDPGFRLDKNPKPWYTSSQYKSCPQSANSALFSFYGDYFRTEQRLNPFKYNTFRTL